MATCLKNFNQKLANLTVDNVAIAAVIRSAEKCGISLEEIKQWSAAIQDEFCARNQQEVSPGAGLQEMYEHQSRMLAQLVSQNANLKAQCSKLEESNTRLETKFDTLLRAIAPDPASPQAAAGVRRIREDGGSADANGRPARRQRTEP
jgi:DNA-binding transcriptional MerR regulator